jgi:hypothetical protein
MKTDELIRALSADGVSPPFSIERRFVMTVLPGLLIAAGLFLVILGPRPDAATAIGSIRFDFKFVITLLLAACAGSLVLRLVRPAAAMTPALVALASVPIVLFAGVLAELVAVPPSLWETRLVGENALVCMMCIPLFALPVLAAALYALRAGAPTRPALAGITAGLFAGGLGGALYAAHCPDDSPLFVATWYSIGILAVALVGGLLGRRFLRW